MRGTIGIVTPVLLLCVGWSGSALPQTCGDFNCSGVVTSADVFEYTRALWHVAVIQCVPDSLVDVDHQSRVTTRDVAWIWRYLSQIGPPPECDSLGPPILPDSGGGIFVLFDGVIPAGVSEDTVLLDVVTPHSLSGLSMSVKLMLDGQPFAPEFIHIDHDTGWNGRALIHPVDSLPANVFLFGVVRVGPAKGPGRFLINRLPITVTPAAFDRTLTMELYNFDSAYADPLYSRNTVAVDGDLHNWQVTIGPTECPVQMTGDVDMSSMITSADVIRLVNYVFKSGETPMPCSPAGDNNCDLAVNSADVIVLVNYVFKGGVAPCDACTAYAAPWGCL